MADRDLWQEMRLPSHGRAATRTSTKRTTKLGFFAAGAAADTAVSTAAQSAASIVATTLQVAGEVFCAVVWITKYGWIYKITIWITVKKKYYPRYPDDSAKALSFFRLLDRKLSGSPAAAGASSECPALEKNAFLAAARGAADT